MDILQLAKAIIETGVLVIIAGVFLSQQKTLFERQERAIEALAKLEQKLNTDILKGRALEQFLLLKMQEARWRIQTKIIDYIERNHLQQNWDIIRREIDTYCNAKVSELDDDLTDIVETPTRKATIQIFKTELMEVKQLLVELLDELRVEGLEHKELYAVAKRALQEHMNNAENSLKAKIKEII